MTDDMKMAMLEKMIKQQSKAITDMKRDMNNHEKMINKLKQENNSLKTELKNLASKAILKK